jgi:hypothetical protein
VTFRRLAVVLALVAAGAVTAFVVLPGREAARDVGPPVGDPLAEALGFAPAAAPVVAVLVTDRKSPARRDLAGLGQRFPAAELARAQVDGLLRDRVGVGERDLRPLLGNPAIAWASRVDALADGGLSWVATDGARLEELLEERAQAGRLRPAAARARLRPLRRAGRRRRRSAASAWWPRPTSGSSGRPSPGTRAGAAGSPARPSTSAAWAPRPGPC